MSKRIACEKIAFFIDDMLVWRGKSYSKPGSQESYVNIDPEIVEWNAKRYSNYRSRIPGIDRVLVSGRMMHFEDFEGRKGSHYKTLENVQINIRNGWIVSIRINPNNIVDDSRNDPSPIAKAIEELVWVAPMGASFETVYLMEDEFTLKQLQSIMELPNWYQMNNEIERLAEVHHEKEKKTIHPVSLPEFSSISF